MSSAEPSRKAEDGWDFVHTVPLSGWTVGDLAVCITMHEMTYRQKADATEEDVNQAISFCLRGIEKEIREALAKRRGE